MSRNILFLLIILMFVQFSCGFKSEKVDLILHNATIYSVDEGFSKHDALAVKDGKIIDLGPERMILNKYSAKKTKDLAKKTVYPGFIDAHCHFYIYGVSANDVDLTGTLSWEECLERIKKHAAENENLWIKGWGWDQNDWKVKSYPTNKELNELFPERPVLLERIDGHAIITNDAGLSIAGINENTSVEGGEIIKDLNGNPTGVLIDNGMNPVYDAEPEPSDIEIEQALISAQKDCFEQGLTTIDDAGLSMNIVNAIEKLQNEGKLKMRVYAMLSPEEKSLEQMKKGKLKTDRLNVRSVKLFGDGSLGSRGACLKEDYSDQPGHKGALIENMDFYKKWAEYCSTYGYQLNTHCIGDSSNSELLKTYASFLREEVDLRWRIEHAQIVSPEDRSFFKQYGIIPSVQPTHATSDMYWAEERIGSDRMSGAYAYKSLLEQMGMLALGTDFPVEDISPIETFHAAISRKDADNYPQDGFIMNEALTREQALKGMTIWAAISNFEEKEKGSLEVGKFADIVVLDRDIMKVNETDLLETKVLYTFVAGEQVYSR